MKVGIDTSPLYNQNAYRGVGTYTENLVRKLGENKSITVVTGTWQNFWRETDLIHFPYFDFFFHTLPLVKKRKTVVTIHDCIPLVFPKYYPPGLKGKIKFYIQTYSLESVSAIITDSQSSKKDITKYLKVPEDKIHVIYLAANEIFKHINQKEIVEKVRNKYNLPAKFILYVGDVNYNKNLINLLKAYGNLEASEVSLVLVGKSFENDNLPEVRMLKNFVKDGNFSKQILFLGFVPTDELAVIYNLASVYCQPSLYEGFGLQILEAMACGCPVVTGNISSPPEVGGEAGTYVDPSDTGSITEGIEKILNDNHYREQKINQGFAQAGKFSWEKTSKETIKVYDKELNG